MLQICFLLNSACYVDCFSQCFTRWFNPPNASVGRSTHFHTREVPFVWILCSMQWRWASAFPLSHYPYFWTGELHHLFGLNPASTCYFCWAFALYPIFPTFRVSHFLAPHRCARLFWSTRQWQTERECPALHITYYTTKLNNVQWLFAKLVTPDPI